MCLIFDGVSVYVDVMFIGNVDVSVLFCVKFVVKGVKVMVNICLMITYVIFCVVDVV